MCVCICMCMCVYIYIYIYIYVSLSGAMGSNLTNNCPLRCSYGLLR